MFTSPREGSVWKWLGVHTVGTTSDNGTQTSTGTSAPDSHPSRGWCWGVFCVVSQRSPSRIRPQLFTIKPSTITSHLLASFYSFPVSSSHLLTPVFWDHHPNIQPVPKPLSQALLGKQTQTKMLSELYPGVSHGLTLGIASNSFSDFPVAAPVVRWLEILWGPEWSFRSCPISAQVCSLLSSPLHPSRQPLSSYQE